MAEPEDEVDALERQLREMRERGTLQAAKSEVTTMQDRVLRQEEQLEALRRELAAAQAEAEDRPGLLAEELRKAEEANARRQVSLIECDRVHREAAQAAADASVAGADLAAAQAQRSALANELGRVERSLQLATQRAVGRCHSHGMGGSSSDALVPRAAREKLAQMGEQMQSYDTAVAELVEKAGEEATAKARPA